MLHSSTLGKMPKRLIVLLAVLASLAGCTMGTTVVGNLPSGVSATTITINSIRVYWTRDPADLSTDTVIVMFGTSIIEDTVIAASPIDSATVTGLAAGVNYTILIGSASGRSQPYPYTLQLTYIPTNVAVISEDTLAIVVTWTRNFNDTSADTLYVTTTNGELAGDSPIIVPPGKSTATVSGLMAGVSYVISVTCATGSSTALGYTVPGVPTNVMFNSLSASTIGVKWSRGVNDTATDTIVAMNAGTVAATVIVPYSTTVTDSMGMLSGLSEGLVYQISVHVSTGISDTGTWMTVERASGIKIYEMSDTLPGDPRGLQLTKDGTQSITLPNAIIPDFVLDTIAGADTNVEFDPSFLANPLWDTTKINPNYNFIRGGLDSNYDSTNYSSDALTNTVTKIPLTTPNDSSSLVLVCQTVTNDWARIEIVPDPTNPTRLYSIASDGFKYITVNVSFQATPGLPYAGRGHPRAAKPSTKRPVHIVKPGVRNTVSSIKPTTSNPVSNIKPVIKNSGH